MFDIVLNNGMLIDPKNSIMSYINIGIQNGKISSLSTEKLEGIKEYDCEGKIISPGFVDMHMHEDPLNVTNEGFDICIAESMLKMGVTTVIGGNCGTGPLNPLNYLAVVERIGYPVNIGLLSSHENLRNNFGSFNKYNNIDSDTIHNMAILLDEELKGGTLGFSFGIRYIPGLSKNEMIELCRVVKKYDCITAAHVRDDAAQVIKSILELIKVGEETGSKIQVSHIGSMAAYGQMEEVCGLIDSYVANGLDIGMDCYPYSAFCTSIGSTTFDQGFLERYQAGYDSLELTQSELMGKSLDAHLFETVRNNHPDYLVVAHVMKESEVEMALCHPRTILASDGILNNGNGHPRAAGTFPRFIREYVINKKSISLFEAINKMTCLPAKRMNISKGALSIGDDADIVVFDINTICDNSTFKEPVKNPSGINYVFIRGNLALKDGVIYNSTLGKPVRR